MKVVSCFGSLWKVSDGAYKRMLNVYLQNPSKGINLYCWGTKVGDKVDLNITDLTPESAREALEEAKKPKKGGK